MNDTERAYKLANRERIRAYNRQWAEQSRRARGCKVRGDYGLPQRLRDWLRDNQANVYTLAEICPHFPDLANRTVSRVMCHLFREGYCTREKYLGKFRYQFNQNPPVKIQWGRPVVVKGPPELPKFDLVPWLGSIMRGKPPGPVGRRIVDLEMAFDKY